MKKTTAAILCGATICLNSITPAFADAGDTAKKVAMFPVTVCAFAVSTVVGIPIAIARKSYLNGAKATDRVCKSDNKVYKSATGLVVGLPYGLVTGSVEGTYLGCKNAAVNSSEHPLSKDSFSMGDMD